MLEIWKDVPQYEGIYKASNLGRIKGIDRINSRGQKIKGKLLKFSKDKFGYLKVGLTKNGIKTSVKVHRIIAITFIPNPLNKPQIDHINTVRDDNKAENLRWTTHKENCNNSISKERYKINGSKIFLGKKHTDETKIKLSNCKKNKFTYADNPNSKSVKCIEEDKVFTSIREAAEFYGLRISGITMCCKGKYKTSGGYHWEYIVKGE